MNAELFVQLVYQYTNEIHGTSYKVTLVKKEDRNDCAGSELEAG